jgi:hypothetical protein
VKSPVGTDRRKPINGITQTTLEMFACGDTGFSSFIWFVLLLKREPFGAIKEILRIP